MVVKAPAMHLTHHAFMHTTDHKWTVDLLKVLDNMNATDYAFGDILAWTRGASAAHTQFLLTGFENTVCLSVRFCVLGRVVVSLTPPPWWLQIVLLAEQGSL